MRFIGIDLAWTNKNETGVCVINEVGEVEYLNSAVLSNDELVSIVKSCSHEPVSIIIDAPLVVKNETGSRSAERELMSQKIHGHNLSLFVASRSYLERTFGQIRGELLMNQILKEIPGVSVEETAIPGRSTIIETFPSAVCCGLFPEIYPVKYKIKRKVQYEETQLQMERILNRFRKIEEDENHISGLIAKLSIGNFVVNKQNHKHIEDKVDAFLSAYGIYLVYKGVAEQKTFGDVENGFITIPIINESSYEHISLSPAKIAKINSRSLSHSDIAQLTICLGELSKSIGLGKSKQKESFQKLQEVMLNISAECFKTQ